MKTLLLYSVVYLARFLSIIASDAYLPLDRSGDWVYRCTEGAGVITMGLLLLCARRFRPHLLLPYRCSSLPVSPRIRLATPISSSFSSFLYAEVSACGVVN